MLKSFFATQKGKAAIAMILSAAFWGLGSVLSKGILEYIPPLKLVEVQLTASVTLLWIVTLSHPGSKRELLPELFDRRQAWKLLFWDCQDCWNPVSDIFFVCWDWQGRVPAMQL